MLCFLSYTMLIHSFTILSVPIALQALVLLTREVKTPALKEIGGGGGLGDYVNTAMLKSS